MRRVVTAALILLLLAVSYAFGWFYHQALMATIEAERRIDDIETAFIIHLLQDIRAERLRNIKSKEALPDQPPK